MAALSRLIEANPHAAVEPLISALTHPSWKVRMYAAERIGQLFEGRDAPDELLRLLRDKSDLVRVQALESLVRIGDRRALSRIRRQLTDRSALVRGYAGEAIGMLGTRSDRPLLAKLLRSEKSDVARLGLLTGLHSLGARSAFNKLLQLLSSDDFEVRTATAATLVGMQDESTKAVIRDAIASALRNERSVNTEAHLRRLLSELDSTTTSLSGSRSMK
jgi:HEAT repeat protein